jgi:hypothetical protein
MANVIIQQPELFGSTMLREIVVASGGVNGIAEDINLIVFMLL